VTSNAEFAPITELNCPMRPHAKTVVEVRADGSTSLSAETPPLDAVAHMTIPRPAMGMMTDFRVKRWRLGRVSLHAGSGDRGCTFWLCG
jgi:hypothetical protein